MRAPYWPLSDPQPSSGRWRTWQKNFLDFITFIPQETPTINLDKPKKLKLLRFNLGIVGQRYFDALKFEERKSLGAALFKLDAIWDQPQNPFLQR